MTYRSDIDALAARKAALSTEVEKAARELHNTTQILDEARARAKLPVLANIRVASPCSADWNTMTPVNGEDRVRECGSCNKNVYSLSDMTREEAEQLILAKNGNLCVRYFQRKDGTILLKDCEIGVSKKRKRRLIAAGAAALLAGSAGATVMKTKDEHRMGGMVEQPRQLLGQAPRFDPIVQPQQDPPVGHDDAKPIHDPREINEVKGGVK
jgi:hypothetical protein